MKQTFAAEYHPGYAPVVEIVTVEPPPVEVTIKVNVSTAAALGRFLRTSKWPDEIANGIALNAVGNNLRAALASIGINV